MKLVSLFVIIVALLNLGSAQSVVDPWVFEERLSLYETLLEATAYPPLFGEDNLNNVLWGLPLQFNWQNRSSRLNINGVTNTKVSAKSWWAVMNYYLSVIPYLGAEKAGVVPKVTLLPPQDNSASKFCLSFENCDQTLIHDWVVYFDTVRGIKNGTISMSLDDLLAILWKAHTTSINYSFSIFESEFNSLPSLQEKQFGGGWSKFVEIIAEARFVTNHSQVVALESALPYRVLKVLDIPGLILDFSTSMNLVTQAMATLHATSKTPIYPVFINSWKIAMKNPNCREVAQQTLNNFFQNPVVEVLLLLTQLVTFCSL